MGEDDAAALRAYHQATKHSVASIRRDAHGLDWANMPRPFKVYPDLPAIPLPRDFATSTRPALAAIADDGTMAAAASQTALLDLATLAHVLYFSAGVLRRRTYPGGEIYFRAAACTGALYHIDLYVVCGELDRLEAGVYHFGPHDFALRRLRAGDHRALVRNASGGEPAVAEAPVLLVFATTFWRNAWKYRTRAYRHAFWDSGTLLANLLAVASGTGLPARLVLGVADGVLDGLLDLDVAREGTLGLVALGGGSTPPPDPPPVAPLGLATVPVSQTEVDYPAIRAAHAASALGSPAEAAAWRRARSTPSHPAADGDVRLPRLPADAVREPIERVILRRGSARTFAREPIDATQLGTILWTATRGIPADFDTPGEIYLVVNAVDGLAPGAYVYDRDAGAVTLLRAGSFRRDAAHLGLGQDLPGDAAVDVFWLVDLEPVFADLGERGYRAAQLAAAVEGGKLYLAAYALELGATGLTFFDDDVTAFFSPHAAGKSVMFLVAVGRPAPRPGRV